MGRNVRLPLPPLVQEPGLSKNHPPGPWQYFIFLDKGGGTKDSNFLWESLTSPWGYLANSYWRHLANPSLVYLANPYGGNSRIIIQ